MKLIGHQINLLLTFRTSSNQTINITTQRYKMKNHIYIIPLHCVGIEPVASRLKIKCIDPRSLRTLSRRYVWVPTLRASPALENLKVY